LKESCKDVVMLNFIGIRRDCAWRRTYDFATMEKMGKKPKFIQGQRVTDEETMDIVEMYSGSLTKNCLTD